jgi:hypothetical protein
MKKAILGLAILGSLVLHVACGKNIPTSSSTSSNGSGTPTATATTIYPIQVSYQNGSGGYSNEQDAWLDGQNPSTYQSASPYLELNVEHNPIVSISGYSRIAVKFTGVSIPSNATILNALVQMTTETNTTIPSGATVSVGLHTFSSAAYNPAASWCMPAWTSSTINWNQVSASLWSSCVGTSSVGQNQGIYNPSANTVVTFTHSDGGVKQVKEWNLNISDLQAEINSSNNPGVVQFLFVSENEFTGDSATSSVDFYPYTDGSGNAAKLFIVYK